MKRINYILALVAILALTSCHQDEEIVNPENGWNYLEGVTYTRDTPFCWTWIVEWKYSDGEKTWVYSEDRTRSFIYDEYLKFFNNSTTGMTIRWGIDRNKEHYNIISNSDKEYVYTFLRPQFHLECQAVDIPVTYCGKKLENDCDLKGSLKLEDGYEIGLFGHRKNNELKIMYYRKNRFNEQLVTRYNTEGKGAWGSINYKFDSNRMKCLQSPIYVEWQTTAWTGAIASLIGNPADFLQLIMAIPIFKAADYGFSGSDVPRENISFERLTRALYSGIYVYDSIPRVLSAEDKRRTHTYQSTYKIDYDEMITMVDIGGNAMKMYFDVEHIFAYYPSSESREARTDYNYNMVRSLLSRTKSYFLVDFQIRETDKYPSPRYLDFRLKEEEESRKLMKNHIIPYMIEYREDIKDYIRNHPTLSKHSVALCTAMDRLEELVEGTTKITLGYNLVEMPLEGDKIFEHLCSEIWESDPEIE